MKKFINSVCRATKIRKTKFQFFPPTKKEKRRPNLLYLSFRYTKNNIFVCIREKKTGKTFCKSSGSLKIEKGLKKTKQAIFLLLEQLEETYSLLEFDQVLIKCKGSYALKSFFLKTLLTNISKVLSNRGVESIMCSVYNSSLIVFNGCRRSKRTSG